MAIPTAVRISGRVFTVEIVKGFDDPNQAGESEYEDSYIKIKKQSTAKMERTLLHEIVHMCLRHSGLDELLLSTSDTTEEAIVCAIENGLTPLYEIKTEKVKRKVKSCP